ncbi:basic proline-rich protein-like [Cricetulus griseus]|uniref:Basic proline-rich protein-like n=1 Tax=Cricetulus griseus TaxID=10029 RepID=A0A9J7G951_CRIGR|nr:basic proline-rich protein-like [Cricetulus griseus]
MGFPGALSRAPLPRPEGTVPASGAGPVAAAGGARTNERRPRPGGGASGALPRPLAGPRPSPRPWRRSDRAAFEPRSAAAAGWVRAPGGRRRLLPPHPSAVPGVRPPGPPSGSAPPAASTAAPKLPPPPLVAPRPARRPPPSFVAAAPPPLPPRGRPVLDPASLRRRRAAEGRGPSGWRGPRRRRPRRPDNSASAEDQVRGARPARRGR